MKKLKKRKDLAGICRKLSAEGRKIVFTNGCFDIIHAGHVRYLKKAKRLGDILVVGLNSDTSVAKIKAGRPINSEKRRVEVLEALSMIDYISIFHELTPYQLIKTIKPDILVKGGDWKKKQIIGHDIVPRTCSLPYVKGISTSGIIRKIKKISH